MSSASFNPIDLATSFFKSCWLCEFWMSFSMKKKHKRKHEALLGFAGKSRAAKLIHTQGGSKTAININTKAKR